MNEERKRLAAHYEDKENWLFWGPYMSERQWATVREDYSEDSNAWGYISHEHSRSYAYRWGEDGLAGYSDEKQRLCFSLALWNQKDPFLKERLFGLTGPEGNHGEDVKELYYYLDSTPTHSYMHYLYKYPGKEFPYHTLLKENSKRNRLQPEYELMDTGIFDKDDYYDVHVEYAKHKPNSTGIRITIENHAKRRATLQVLPQLWFRNTWQYSHLDFPPQLEAQDEFTIAASHPILGNMVLHCPDAEALMFCDNETNPAVFNQPAEAEKYYKDGFNNYLVNGNSKAINPNQKGTKAAALYILTIPAHSKQVLYLQLCRPEDLLEQKELENLFDTRLKEADIFYDHIQKNISSKEDKMIQRQALAGMLWTKQYYYYSIHQWLKGPRPGTTEPVKRNFERNKDWQHLHNASIVSMPDNWEYPWYAAWDLAFHTLPLAMVDAGFAKQQLLLLTQELYMHPNGQLPAYEWNFSDVNPPVHAWAAIRVFEMDKQYNHKPDYAFLEIIFHKLMINFTWWVNQKDSNNNNIFQGGFLGLDNIGLFDRNWQLPHGGSLEQSDATGWMAMYCLNMMKIALELSNNNPTYQHIALKFFEHFLHIAKAMTHVEDQYNLWSKDDEFFYDAIMMPDQKIRLRVRSLVGLIPLFAVEVIDDETLAKNPEFAKRLQWYFESRPDLSKLVPRWEQTGISNMHLLSLVWGNKLQAILKRLLDETEFLSDYGIRALSKVYDENPFELKIGDHQYRIRYTPAESDSDMFGGNSNWRGPVWFPVNYLLIESLQKFDTYYGDHLQVEMPMGSGHMVSLKVAAKEISRRLISIFKRDNDGRRPVFGEDEKMQTDPNFKNHILFYEYFHGDNGRGAGASHQTGWTGLVAKLIEGQYE